MFNTVSVQIRPVSQTHTDAKMHNHALVCFSDMTDALGSVAAFRFALNVNLSLKLILN